MTILLLLLLILILISLWVGFYALVKQQGRILLRLDQIEKDAGLAETSSSAAASEQASEASEPDGLALDTEFPAFKLPDLTGALVGQVGSADLAQEGGKGEKGKRENGKGSANLVSSSAALPASDDEPQTLKNRSALPVNPKSKIENPESIRFPGFMAHGEIGLGELIKRLTSALGIKPCVGCERRAALLNRWLSFSGATGDGLKVGTLAPLFRLPDLEGRAVSLQEYRGRRVLLVFTDPQCRPCEDIAPHLVRLHREHGKNGLAVILVGRGNAEQNRRKAAQHGFQFPMVIQPKWKLSKDYGTFATPVAFLIGEDGMIAKKVAMGRDAILALVAGQATGRNTGYGVRNPESAFRN